MTDKPRPVVDELLRIANDCANDGEHGRALELIALADTIDNALARMTQPDHGDTTAALDFYAEGVNLLKGLPIYG